MTGPTIKVAVRGEWEVTADELWPDETPDEITAETAAEAAVTWWWEQKETPKTTISVTLTRWSSPCSEVLPGMEPPLTAVVTSAEVDL